MRRAATLLPKKRGRVTRRQIEITVIELHSCMPTGIRKYQFFGETAKVNANKNVASSPLVSIRNSAFLSACAIKNLLVVSTDSIMLQKFFSNSSLLRVILPRFSVKFCDPGRPHKVYLRVFAVW